jgi:2-polyprenyl-3-methyl-5-hydroxy-6-metoxy-1,4-benzoquinol methylase
MTSTDVFGAALFAWAKGDRTPEVIERDDGHVEEGAGPDGYLGGLDDWPAAEQRSIRLLRGRIVDAGCGAGRVSLVLQQKGFEVVGIDESPLAVRAARHLGVEDARHLSVESLTKEIEAYDSVLLYGNNVGMFESPERARRLLTAWARRARPGTRIFAESTNAFSGGAPIVDRAYYRRNKTLGLAPGTARFRIRFKASRGPKVTWLFVSQRELRQIVRGTGWVIDGVLADGLTEPYVAILERR